jgi:hypothetical protein
VASFAKGLPVVEEGVVISANLLTFVIGNINLGPLLVGATTRSDCRMDPSREVRRRQSRRRFQTSGANRGVSFTEDKKSCIVDGRGDRLSSGNLGR